MAGMENDLENPFGGPTDTLRESRINSTRGEPSRVDTAALGDYNPFEAKPSDLSGNITSAPAFPPAYSALEAQIATTEELERRQKELDAKAAELARREEEQNRLSEQARRGIGPTNNWPPLPSFCPCAPCFYLNIGLEIIPDYQKIVFIGYYLWLIYSGLLCANLLGALIYFAGTGRSDGGSLFGVSILVCIFCIPASFLCWFRPLYKAFRSNSSINFFIFFIVFAAQVFVMGIQSLGILNWGSCGWITGLTVVRDNPGIGSITLVLASVFTVMTVVCTLYLIRVHRIYRSTGASFGKAREEFARGMVFDPNVGVAAVGTSLYAPRY